MSVRVIGFSTLVLVTVVGMSGSVRSAADATVAPITVGMPSLSEPLPPKSRSDGQVTSAVRPLDLKKLSLADFGDE